MTHIIQVREPKPGTLGNMNRSQIESGTARILFCTPASLSVMPGSGARFGKHPVPRGNLWQNVRELVRWPAGLSGRTGRDRVSMARIPRW